MMKSLRNYPKRNSRANSHIMGFFALLLLVVVVAISVDRLKQSQDVRKEASENDNQEQLPKKIGILELAYFPPQTNDGAKLDPNITGGPDLPITDAKAIISRRSDGLKAQLGLATKYHGYTTQQAKEFADPEARQFLSYETIKKVEYTKPMPLSNNPAPKVGNPDKKAVRPDYIKMLQDIDICKLVDNPIDSERVREVWVWGYHTDVIEPVESNMSMGQLLKAYWNYGSYGDISNSEHTNDLPVCQHSYVLYNYSGMPNRPIVDGHDMEDHTHQVEAVMEWLDTPNGNKLFWNGILGSPHHQLVEDPGCGWTHYTPNSLVPDEDYEWYLERVRKSDCMSWNPSRSGQKVDVSCHTWAGDVCDQDGGVAFKTWLLQSLPGYNNKIDYELAGEHRFLTNWWEAIYDLRNYLSNYGRSLSQVSSQSPNTSPPEPAPLPDMALETKNFPTKLNSGQQYNFTVKITNLSSTPITSSAYLYLYDSKYKDFHIQSANPNCHQMSNSPMTTECLITESELNQSGGFELNFDFTAPSDEMTEGKYKIFLHSGRDQNNDNQKLAINYTVVNQEANGPARLMISSTLPQSMGAFTSEAQNFTFTIENKSQYTAHNVVLELYELTNTSAFVDTPRDRCAKITNDPTRKNLYRCSFTSIPGNTTQLLNFSLLPSNPIREEGTIFFMTNLMADNLDPVGSLTKDMRAVVIFPNYADVDRNNKLDRDDYNFIASHLLTTISGENLKYQVYDVNDDGFIDLIDLRYLTKQPWVQLQ